MRFSTLLPLVLAAGALATPVLERGTWPAPTDLLVRHDKHDSSNSSTRSAFTPTPIEGCLRSSQATKIVNAFLYLLASPTAANFNSTATSLFTKDFTDTSDSIDQLAGLPEGSVTFSSRAAFIAGSGSQPPLYLQTLDVFNSCNKIGWRWISINGTGNDKEKVKGIDVFEISRKGKIRATFAEFNSGAWLLDLGNPECSSTSKAKA